MSILSLQQHLSQPSLRHGTLRKSNEMLNKEQGMLNEAVRFTSRDKSNEQ